MADRSGRVLGIGTVPTIFRKLGQGPRGEDVIAPPVRVRLLTGSGRSQLAATQAYIPSCPFLCVKVPRYLLPLLYCTSGVQVRAYIRSVLAKFRNAQLTRRTLQVSLFTHADAARPVD